MRNSNFFRGLDQAFLWDQIYIKYSFILGKMSYIFVVSVVHHNRTLLNNKKNWGLVSYRWTLRGSKIQSCLDRLWKKTICMVQAWLPIQKIASGNCLLMIANNMVIRVNLQMGVYPVQIDHFSKLFSLLLNYESDPQISNRGRWLIMETNQQLINWQCKQKNWLFAFE